MYIIIKIYYMRKRKKKIKNKMRNVTQRNAP